MKAFCNAIARAPTTTIDPGEGADGGCPVKVETREVRCDRHPDHGGPHGAYLNGGYMLWGRGKHEGD